MAHHVWSGRTEFSLPEIWHKLAEGRKEGPCGWLEDKFGLSWQIAAPEWDFGDPSGHLLELLTRP